MFDYDDFPFVFSGIIIVIMIVVLFVIVLGNDSESPTNNYVEGEDCIIQTIEQSDNYEIFYDKSTLVLYIKTSTGLSVMYNTDGSIKLYEKEEK